MIVLRVEGGVVHAVDATREHADIPVVILDADTEGGDPDQITEIDGEEVYASVRTADALLSPEAAAGLESHLKAIEVWE